MVYAYSAIAQTLSNSALGSESSLDESQRSRWPLGHNLPPLSSLSLWTEAKSDGSIDLRTCRAYAPLPLGMRGSSCLRCASDSLVGALITENADERDPNLLCVNCNYWRD